MSVGQVALILSHITVDAKAVQQLLALGGMLALCELLQQGARGTATTSAALQVRPKEQLPYKLKLRCLA